jgi:hypothetical protein
VKRYSPLIVRGSLLLMESLWLYALVAWLIAITVGGERPTFIGVAAVVFASFGISRALQNSDFSLGILRIWGALLSIIVFYAIVRLDFYGDLRLWDLTFLDDLTLHTNETLDAAATAVIGVPVLWLFWMRGVLRGQQTIAFEDVLHSFAIGVVIVAFVALFAGIEDDLPREVDFIPVPYIAIGLLAISLAHTSKASDQFERGFTKDWLMFAGGGLVALAIVGLLFAVVDFDTARDGLELVGRGIGFVVAGILYVIVWPIIQVIALGMEAFRFLIDLYGGSKNPPVQQPPLDPSNVKDNQDGNGIVPGWVELTVRLVVGGGLLTMLLVGTAMLFQRFRKTAKPEEARESTYQEGRLASDLGDMLSSFFGRFRGHRQADVPQEPVRRLYFEMLDTAAARGVERRPMETPLELTPRINRTISGPIPADITHLFDDVRYGAHPPSEEDLRRLRDAWDKLPK